MDYPIVFENLSITSQVYSFIKSLPSSSNINLIHKFTLPPTNFNHKLCVENVTFSKHYNKVLEFITITLNNITKLKSIPTKV